VQATIGRVGSAPRALTDGDRTTILRLGERSLKCGTVHIVRWELRKTISVRWFREVIVNEDVRGREVCGL